jgi:cell wall-associated NlpC family hydrolase
VPAQCANFVRHVFASLGATLPVAQHPYDEAVCLRYGITPITGPGLAAGLAGSELGQVFPGGQEPPRAGDLVLFAGTYNPEGIPAEAVPALVTHVGICTGPGMMVDRSTSARPVTERPLATFASLACCVRPRYR